MDGQPVEIKADRRRRGFTILVHRGAVHVRARLPATARSRPAVRGPTAIGDCLENECHSPADG